MAKKRVADVLVDTLVAADVKRVYGLVGDSLNGVTDSIRPRKDLQWVPVRHEETAAFAAGAEAQLTEQLTVCAGSCGPGNLHLINGLYDCHRSRVPVLAIAADPERGNRERIFPGNAPGTFVRPVQSLLRTDFTAGTDAADPGDRDPDCNRAPRGFSGCATGRRGVAQRGRTRTAPSLSAAETHRLSRR